MKVFEKERTVDAVKVDVGFVAASRFIKTRRGSYEWKNSSFRVWPQCPGAGFVKAGDYIIYNGFENHFDTMTKEQFEYFYEVDNAEDQ